jgi:hypothetical protein
LSGRALLASSSLTKLLKWISIRYERWHIAKDGADLKCAADAEGEAAA